MDRKPRRETPARQPHSRLKIYGTRPSPEGGRPADEAGPAGHYDEGFAAWRGARGRRYAHGDTIRARHADPGLRAQLVAAARRQGAGDLRHARALRDALLPAAERPHRPARGTRVRPRPGQAAAAAALPAEPDACGGARGRGGAVTATAG